MIIDTYQTAIGSKKYGEGAARAVLICIFLSLFCLAYFRVTRRLQPEAGNERDQRRDRNVPPSVAAAAEARRRSRAAAQVEPDRSIALIDRYAWYELVGIYAGICLFLAFLLAPFVEGFLVSLKPLEPALLLALPLHSGERLLRRLPDDVGRACRASRATSSTASSSRPSRRPSCSLLVIPAAYAFSRFDFKGAGLRARRLPRRQHVLGRGAASSRSSG